MAIDAEPKPVALAVEILPTQDRTTVCLLFRGSSPIPMAVLIEAMEGFASTLKEKFLNKSKIEKPPVPKIITP